MPAWLCQQLKLKTYLSFKAHSKSLTALEAIDQLSLGAAQVLIILPDMFKQSDYQPILDNYDWESIVFHKFSISGEIDYDAVERRSIGLHFAEARQTLRQMMRRRRLDKLLSEYPSVRRLFLGNYKTSYGQQMRHIANKLSFEELWLVDNGTDTEKLSKERIDEIRHRESERSAPQNESIPHPGVLKRIRTRLRKQYCDWNTAGANKVRFFSAFDISVIPPDVLVRNNFSRLKRMVSDNIDHDTAIFVGDPAWQDGIMSRESYMNHLRFIQRDLATKKVMYAPHPRESEEIVAAVQNELGWSIQPILGSDRVRISKH